MIPLKLIMAYAIVSIFFIILGSFSVQGYRSVNTIYHPKNEMIGMFKAICDNSDKCDYEIAGKTYLNKDIYLFKIGNVSGKKIMMDGSMHGWEDSGTEIMYNFSKWILSSSDPKAKMMLKQNLFLLMPIVNMDTINRTSMRRDDPDGRDLPFGVDINRNFCPGWGSYTNINTWYYQGQWCKSEKETQAVVSVMRKYKPIAYINWHMGGGKMWMSCGSKAYYDKIYSNYNKYAISYGVSKYSLSYTSKCGEGMAISQAVQDGVKIALLTETVESTLLPNNYKSFLDQYYQRNFVMILSVVDAVNL